MAERKNRIKARKHSLKHLRTGQSGAILIGLLIFMVFVGLIITSLLTLLAAEAKMQVVDSSQRQALYAAESGMEYAMRLINEYANDNSTLIGLHNYTEDVDAGNGSTSQIKIELIGSNQIKVTAIGRGANFVKVMEKTIEYINVSQYAVYSTGDVRYINTVPAGSFVQNAQYFPLFDLDEMRDIAKPGQYFSGNLTISGIFSFVKDIAFVEGKLTFGNFNWANFGNFVAGDEIRIKTSWLPLGFTKGAMFQFKPGGRFRCDWNLLWRALDGGLITNGDAVGTSIPFFPFRFRVYRNQSVMKKFFKYSVNGGPLILKTKQVVIH